MTPDRWAHLQQATAASDRSYAWVALAAALVVAAVWAAWTWLQVRRRHRRNAMRAELDARTADRAAEADR